MADTETTLDPKQAEQHRLIEEAAALLELEQHPGYGLWRRYAEEFLQAHQALLAAGGINDLGEYRMIAGRVQGIQQLLGLREAVERARDRELAPPENYVDELALFDGATTQTEGD